MFWVHAFPRKCHFPARIKKVSCKIYVVFFPLCTTAQKINSWRAGVVRAPEKPAFRVLILGKPSDFRGVSSQMYLVLLPRYVVKKF